MGIMWGCCLLPNGAIMAMTSAHSCCRFRLLVTITHFAFVAPYGLRNRLKRKGSIVQMLVFSEL